MNSTLINPSTPLADQILGLVALVLTGMAMLRFAQTRRLEGAPRTWLLIAAIFAVVILWHRHSGWA